MAWPGSKDQVFQPWLSDAAGSGARGSAMQRRGRADLALISPKTTAAPIDEGEELPYPNLPEPSQSHQGVSHPQMTVRAPQPPQFVLGVLPKSKRGWGDSNDSDTDDSRREDRSYSKLSRRRPSSSHQQPLRSSKRVQLKNEMHTRNEDEAHMSESNPRGPTQGQAPEDARSLAARRETELYEVMLEWMPGAWFGYADALLHAGYWDLYREYTLRKEWDPADEESIRNETQSNAEVQVWQVMSDLFDCTPADLFRYGLELDLYPDVDTSGHDPSLNVHLPDSFAEELHAILLSPIWAGDIARVRYVLQKAIWARVEGHALPLGPPYSRARPPFWATSVDWSQGRTPGEQWGEEAELNIFLWDTGFKTSHEIEAVEEQIVESSALLDGPLPPAGKDAERFRFLLQTTDLITVRAALDRCHSALIAAGELPPSTPVWLGKEWARWRARDGDGAAGGDGDVVRAPAARFDRSRLVILKKEWALSLRREAAIRKRMIDLARDECLWDVPPFDPNPFYEHALYDKASPQAVMAAQGWFRSLHALVRPPGKA